MAQVDFTNARLELVGTTFPMNHVWTGYVGLNVSVLTDASGATIVANNSVSILKDEQKSVLFSYTGTFTASGTEFYIPVPNIGNTKWKVSNISFQNGDAYTFQIPVSLTCL